MLKPFPGFSIHLPAAGTYLYYSITLPHPYRGVFGRYGSSKNTYEAILMKTNRPKPPVGGLGRLVGLIAPV
jgi:hypothetical protein